MGDDLPPPRLLVGLGNPGPKYENTRHNMGFIAIDDVARRFDAPVWENKSAWESLTTKTDSLILQKPITYMNLSGRAIATVARFFKITPPEILILSDDIALPPGRIRLRRRGSDGGHNGLASIITHLGTNHFPRLRIGVGSAAEHPLPDHVLGKFSSDETPLIDQAIKKVGDCLIFILENGYNAAMNKFN
ncbi:MAG: aminoacyl-tRNA hydrolase [Chthoniobacterales bacterium]